MSDSFEHDAIRLTEKIQELVAGERTSVVSAALMVLVADCAVNMGKTVEEAQSFVDGLARFSKEKVSRDWQEARATLEAFIARDGANLQ